VGPDGRLILYHLNDSDAVLACWTGVIFISDSIQAQPTMPSDQEARRIKTLAALERLALDPGPVAAVMQCDPSDPDSLINVLAECPVLAGRVIGVANSAGSSAVHRMDSIQRCVRHLGARQARTVALTMAMQLMVQGLELDQDVVRQLWVSAATKAVAAQLVAERISPQHAETAYSMGLLQDIALPALLALDPKFFTNTLANNDGKIQWTDLERSHFGIDHAELGALLLQQWNAPPAIVMQVRRHHVALADDDMAWVAEMPSRFAGLLPHMDETTAKGQQQTLAATHARFLGEGFDCVDTLLKEIHRRVKAMGKTAGGPVKLNADFIQQIIRAVSSDTFALASQISRLDQQLSRQMGLLAHTQEDALSDSLTGLLNRRGFESIGKQMLAQANKANHSAACLMIDLDDFKPVNDTFGHAAGDRILKAAADLLKSNVGPGDLVARMGGDEFAVLLIGDSQGEAYAMAQRLHAVCNGRRIALGNDEKTTLCMSIGGVFMQNVPRDTVTSDLVEAADKIMYGIKRTGKHGLNFEPMNKAA